MAIINMLWSAFWLLVAFAVFVLVVKWLWFADLTPSNSSIPLRNNLEQGGGWCPPGVNRGDRYDCASGICRC